MTKQVNSKNQIWFEQNDNVVTVGFTRDFLALMGECWHIMPANMERFREHAPLMVVETNDRLISIKSPVAANFTMFNAKAQNFPDQLTEDDVIFELRLGAPVRREAPRQRNIDEVQIEFADPAPQQAALAGWANDPVVRMLEERQRAELRAIQQAAVPRRRPEGRF